MAKKRAYLWRSAESAIDGRSGDEAREGGRCLYCLRGSILLSTQRVLPFSAGVRVEAVACDACGPGPLREIDSRLEALLEPLRQAGSISEQAAVEAIGRDPLALRAIAKIAFNYLALRHGKAAALEPRFDPVRDYIRDGGAGGDRVRLADRSPRMPFRKIKRTHYMALVSRKTDVLGFGSLFGGLDFGVRLGPQARGEDMIPHLTYWHCDAGRVENVTLQDLPLYFASIGAAG